MCDLEPARSMNYAGVTLLDEDPHFRAKMKRSSCAIDDLKNARHREAEPPLQSSCQTTVNRCHACSGAGRTLIPCPTSGCVHSSAGGEFSCRACNSGPSRTAPCEACGGSGT